MSSVELKLISPSRDASRRPSSPSPDHVRHGPLAPPPHSPPGDLWLAKTTRTSVSSPVGSTPNSPATNGGLGQGQGVSEGHTGFKSGKVSPVGSSDVSPSPTQRAGGGGGGAGGGGGGGRKSAWERAQEKHEAEEQQARQETTQLRPLEFHTDFTPAEQCCSVQKVSEWG